MKTSPARRHPPSAAVRVRTLLPGTRRLPAAAAPDLRGRSYRIDVELRRALADAAGVLLAAGDGQAGYALHVADGCLVHTYHHAGASSVVTAAGLRSRARTLSVTVTIAGSAAAEVALLADDRLVGEGRIGRVAHARLTYAGLDVGCDRGPGVGAYAAPFAFTGDLRRVVFTTEPAVAVDEAGALAIELATG